MNNNNNNNEKKKQTVYNDEKRFRFISKFYLISFDFANSLEVNAFLLFFT